MGALLAGILVIGIGAALLGGAKADAGPKPQGMLGTSVLRISSGAHTLTITRHGQGYAWYVHRGSDVLESSNEASLAGAQSVGLESLQGYIGANATMRLVWLLDPMMIARVSPVGAADGPWGWVVTIEGAERDGQEPSRPEAVMAVLDLFQGEQVPVPQPQPQPEGEGVPGIVGEPAAFAHGIEIQGDNLKVVDLDAWIEAASPVVLDAIDAGDDTAQPLADAVLGFLLEYNTDGLTIDGKPWSPVDLQTLLNNMAAKAYVDVAPPEHKLAAAIVNKTHTMVGQAGRHLGDVWVVVPYGSGYAWLTFAKTRMPDEEALASGFEATQALARDAAKNAISEAHFVGMG